MTRDNRRGFTFVWIPTTVSSRSSARTISAFHCALARTKAVRPL